MALEDAPEHCFTWPNYGWFFEQWLAQQNAPFTNNDNGRYARATDSPSTAMPVWRFWSGLTKYDKGYLYYSGAQGGDLWTTVDQVYQTQQVAMAAYSNSDTTLSIPTWARTITSTPSPRSCPITTTPAGPAT